METKDPFDLLQSLHGRIIAMHETARKLTAAELLEKGVKLCQLSQSLQVVHTFKPGDLVEWKPGLRDRKFPEYGEPVVVVELKPGLITSDKDSGTPYFQQPIDIVIGHLDEDGEFMCYHTDSARLQPWVPPTNPDNAH